MSEKASEQAMYALPRRETGGEIFRSVSGKCSRTFADGAHRIASASGAVLLPAAGAHLGMVLGMHGESRAASWKSRWLNAHGPTSWECESAVHLVLLNSVKSTN